MRLTWHVDADDVRRVTDFYRQHKRHPFVRERKKRNVDSPPTAIRKGVFWKTMVMCLLTTQQRSGEGSPVKRFMKQRPFPLRYGVCKGQGNLEAYCKSAISHFGGIRRGQTIAGQISANRDYLERDGWQTVLSALRTLHRNRGSAHERDVARLIADSLHGFGPKQSRNLLQALGVTRYEIPIDSRVTKWLNSFGLVVPLKAAALADQDYYCFVLDGFRELCRRSHIWPCLMDAAIFISFDVK